MIPYFKKGLGLMKKVIFAFAIYFLVLNIFSAVINKNRPKFDTTGPIKNSREAIYKTINDKKLNSTAEGKKVLFIYRSFTCGWLGEGCTPNPEDGNKNYKNSLFGKLTNLFITPLSYPPASGIAWAAQGLEEAGFIPKTLASEGIGFSAIKPFSNLWKIFRDLAYMILVLVLITIGFMIMFRMKMNPQTVISVENALPKIVVALILITFSFPIAGLMIDIMYMAIGLIVSVIIGPQFPNDVTKFTNEYMLSGTMDLWLRDMRLRMPLTQSPSGEIARALLGIIPLEVEIILRSLIGLVTIILSSYVLTPIIENVSIGLTNIAFGGATWGGIPKLLAIPLYLLAWGGMYQIGFYTLITPVFAFLMMFSMVLLFIRIIALMFANYLKLILLVILSPVLLLFEAVPGKSTFKYFLMNILGNLILFPLTIGVFCLSYVILNGQPQIDFTARLPYLYGINSDSFRVLVATGLIFLIPDLYKWLKDTLQIKDLPFTVGLGTYFGGVTTGLSGGVGVLGQIGSISLGLGALGIDTKSVGKDFLNALKPKPKPSATGGP